MDGVLLGDVLGGTIPFCYLGGSTPSEDGAVVTLIYYIMPCSQSGV